MGAPPAAEGEAWSRIVGVVDDVHETALHEEPPEMAYYPVTGETFVADVPWPMRYVVRAPNAAALAGPVREAVRGQQTTEYMELFRQLRDAVHMLQGSRDDFNAMIDEDRVKEQTESH